MPAHSEPQPPVVESVLDPVYPYRPRRISPTTLLLTGYTPDEFQADPALFVTRVHPDDFARVVGLYRQVGAAGHAVADYRFMHKSGGYRWLHEVLTLVRDDDGTPAHILGQTMDVTSRRHTEARLIGREEYFRRLIENASDVFVVVGLDGTILYESPSVRRLAGYTSDEVVGRNAYDFVHPDDAAELKRQLALVFAATDGLVPTEFRHRRADGTWRVVQAVASRLMEDGRLTGAIVNMRDISDRKRLEEQLQQSRKMEAVGRLAGGIAHDFNNLLTAVIGYAELLLDQMPEGSEHRDDLYQIKRAGESAATLTRQLLAFSRRQTLEPRTLDLNVTVSETTAMLSRMVGEDIALEADLDSGLGPVHADAGQLEQALVEMCMNAREAMPRGGRVTIRTRRVVFTREHVQRHWTVPPGTFSTITVEDAGIGMPDEVLQHIFEPFFSTKPRTRGAGLGLASAYGIVAQSGGYVSADSTPSVGSEVTIYLPELLVEAETDFSVATPDPSDGPGATVLLVEDNDLLSTFAHSVLRSKGFVVLSARNADEAEAREASFEQPIDLLLTDVVMPGRSGVALADLLIRRRPGMRCLYMSGYNEEALLRHGIVAGDVAFLPKPFTAKGLLQKVRETLRAPLVAETRHPGD